MGRVTSLRAALVVIDMQRCFFEAEPLASERERLVAACNELLTAADEAGTPAFTVRTEHHRDRSTWTLNMLEDDRGFAFTGNDDAQYVEGLENAAAHEILKTRDSAFLDTPLAAELARLGVETVIVAGVSSHTCVAATAADAYAHDFHVVLAEDAIASHRPELHDVALATLCQEFRLGRMPVVEVAAALREDPDRLART